jgi:tRNA-(ms[2]io[6]A)-hydroxylase
MTTLTLRYQTRPEWTELVVANMDEFLPDHAAAEKKAASMATTMISHYPDRERLVHAMADLAIEELSHFREVVKLIYARGLTLVNDTKDPYVVNFRNYIRKGRDEYLIDRLLIAGIIEARGAERFGLIGEALQEGALKRFYQAIARSEQRHETLFVDLALEYFPASIIEPRIDELLDAEAAIVADLPLRAILH